MPQTPDNLKQVSGEGIDTAPESRVLEGDVVRLGEGVGDKVVEVLNETDIRNDLNKRLHLEHLQPRVGKRIYLMRHYPYIEDDNYIRYNDLLKMKVNREIMSPEEKRELLKCEKRIKCQENAKDIPNSRLRESLETLLKESGKTLVVFDNIWAPERVQETGKNVSQKKDVKNDVFMPGSEKGISYIQNFLNMGSNLSIAMNELNSEKYKKYDTIIIVSNRSYAPAFQMEQDGVDTNLRESINVFEEKGYLYQDRGESGEIISRQDTILKIEPSNYQEFTALFPEIKSTSCQDFQNQLIDKASCERMDFFREYLFHGDSPRDLRIFCIINLLRKKDVHSLNKFFRNEEFDIFDFGNLTEKERVILNYYFTIHPDILSIRKKSINKKIVAGENVKMYYNFSNPNYNKDNSNWILDLLKTGKPIKYIEGRAGSGKTSLLVSVAEELNYENISSRRAKNTKPYQSVYINLSGMGFDVFEKELNVKLNDIDVQKCEAVFLIDSIDESYFSAEDRKKLDDKLLKLSEIGKIIVTSRNGYSAHYENQNEKEQKQKKLLDDSQEKIELEDLTDSEIEKYVDSYFINPYSDEILDTWEILIKLDGVGHNPLLLHMICEMTEGGIMTNKKIEELNVVDIYDEIIARRLKEFNLSKNQSRKITKESYFKSVIDGLKKIAFDQIFHSKKIKNIDDYISVHDDSAIEGINLLFRKGHDGVEYDFIHQSFKEYFAAKYIFEKMRRGSNIANLPDFLIKCDYSLLDFLVDFIKSDTLLINRAVSAISTNAKTTHSITGKQIYVLSKLNMDAGRMIFNDDVKKGNDYKNHELIAGIIKTDIPGSEEYIEGLLRRVVQDDLPKTIGYSGNRNSADSSSYYHLSEIVKLITNTPYEKCAYRVMYNLYKDVSLSSKTRFFDECTFRILYKYVDGKAEFLKQMLRYSKENQYIRQNAPLLDAVYKAIGHCSKGDLKYIMGEEFEKKDNSAQIKFIPDTENENRTMLKLVGGNKSSKFKTNIQELIDFENESIEVSMLIDLMKKRGFFGDLFFLNSYEDYFLAYTYIFGFDSKKYMYFLNKSQNSGVFAKNILGGLLENRKNVFGFIYEFGLSKLEIKKIYENLGKDDFFLSHVNDVFKGSIKNNIRGVLYYLFIIFRDTDNYGDRYWNENVNKNFVPEEMIKFFRYIGYTEKKIKNIFRDLIEYMTLKKSGHSRIITENPSLLQKIKEVYDAV